MLRLLKWLSFLCSRKKNQKKPSLIHFFSGQEPGDPEIVDGDVVVSTGLQNADPCTARRCKWPSSSNGLVYIPYVLSSGYCKNHLLSQAYFANIIPLICWDHLHSPSKPSFSHLNWPKVAFSHGFLENMYYCQDCSVCS